MLLYYSLICFVLSVITEAGKVGDSLAEDFFREEYILNNAVGEHFNYTCVIDYRYIGMRTHSLIVSLYTFPNTQASALSVYMFTVSFSLFLHVLFYLLSYFIRNMQETIYRTY